MRKLSSAAAIFFLLLTGHGLAQGVENGDFTDGLNGWTTQGDVQVVDDAARLGDNLATHSLLYQGVALPPGTYTLTFDFKNMLSSTASSEPPFVFFDVFFATLFFVNDLSQFDPQTGQFDDVRDLFGMDYSGPFGVTGRISGSPKGPDWARFTVTFSNKFNYAIPYFELYDLNFINNDSQVLIDNVGITAAAGVPATSLWSIIVFAIGLLGIYLKSRGLASPGSVRST
jgi:hypothetical protein